MDKLDGSGEKSTDPIDVTLAAVAKNDYHRRLSDAKNHYARQMAEWRVSSQRLAEENEMLEERISNLKEDLDRARTENRALFARLKDNPDYIKLSEELEREKSRADWQQNVFDNELKKLMMQYEEIEMASKRKFGALALGTVAVWAFMIAVIFFI